MLNNNLETIKEEDIQKDNFLASTINFNIQDKTAKSSPSNTEDIYLFMSFDLENGTKYKNHNHDSWLRLFCDFYIFINDKMSTDFSSTYTIHEWKKIGDEVLLYCRITENNQIYNLLEESQNTINAWNNIKIKGINRTRFCSPLRAKATLWIADVHHCDDCIVNEKKEHSSSIKCIHNANNYLIKEKNKFVLQEFEELEAELVKYTDVLQKISESSTEPSLITKGEERYKRIKQNIINHSSEIDFLGHEIDVGFRISKFSTPGTITLGAKLAYFLLTSSTTDKTIVNNIKIVGYEKLKGIWRDRRYPIIWYARDFEEINFLYDDKLENEFINNFYKNIKDILKENTKNNLELIFEDTGYLKVIQKIMEELNSLVEKEVKVV